jgi:iron(III) transport system substrate-binding protein
MRNLLFGIALLFMPLPALADMEKFFADLNGLPPAERQQKLINGAKKEGEVMLYTSSGLEEVRSITKLFMKKYPFINARSMRKGGSQLFNVSLLEFRGQKHLVDVYWAGFSTLGPILNEEKKMLARYVSPERAATDEDYKDKAGYWTATRVSVAIFAYHSKLVPRDKVPKVFPDLLDPFWKGKLAMDTNPPRFPAALSERMGRERAETYMRQLAKQEPKLHRGRSARVQLILAGEVLGSLDINADNIVEMQLNGAPLEYAIMDPTLLSLTSVAMPSKPPHPHAAALLYDFFLSKEGQEELAREKNVAVREGVEVFDKELARRLKDAKAKNLLLVQSPGTYDPSEEEKLDRLYIDIFVKKTK